MADRGRARTRTRSPSKGGSIVNDESQKHKDKKNKKKDKEAKKKEAARLLAEAEAVSSESSDAADAAEALALPDNNTTIDPALINSLCRAINTMTSSMSKVEKGLEQVQTELRQQKSQVAAVVSTVEKIAANTNERIMQFETDMKAANIDIDARIAKLVASTSTPRPDSYASAAASGAASSAGPARAAAMGGPPAGGHRPTRLWIKGFKETLTTKFLNEYARKAVGRLPPDLRSGAKSGAPGFGTAVYIDYPLGTPMAPIKAALLDLALKHTDDAGEEHSLRITPDQPLAVRHKGRVLGELWKLVEPYLTGLPAASRPKDFKLGNSNGKLFLVLDHRPLELFATSFDDLGNMNVTPNLANLGKYQIDDTMAQSWAAAASRSAARSGQ
jgi:hypothetical protein